MCGHQSVEVLRPSVLVALRPACAQAFPDVQTGDLRTEVRRATQGHDRRATALLRLRVTRSCIERGARSPSPSCQMVQSGAEATAAAAAVRHR